MFYDKLAMILWWILNLRFYIVFRLLAGGKNDVGLEGHKKTGLRELVRTEKFRWDFVIFFNLTKVSMLQASIYQ